MNCRSQVFQLFARRSPQIALPGIDVEHKRALFRTAWGSWSVIFAASLQLKQVKPRLARFIEQERNLAAVYDAKLLFQIDKTACLVTLLWRVGRIGFPLARFGHEEAFHFGIVTAAIELNLNRCANEI